MKSTELLAKYPTISDQVSKDQLAVILGEIEKVLPKLDGAIVEFGCYAGTTSLFIRRLLDTSTDQREFHVYDSFEGLPPKTTEDESRAGEQFKAGELNVSKKQFLHEFQKANLRPPIVHKGWFKDLAAETVPDSIALAFLDGDFYASIRDSLRLVLPHMQAGGVIIVDDYAREALPGAAKAVHEYFKPELVRTSHNLGVIRV
jgi:O-methyltransferase